MEKVPIWVLAMTPPFHSTMARAREEAKFMVTAKAPRSLAAPTLLRRMEAVSVTKDFSIFSSITRVLMVRAPVMPSLKSPVIWELSSRISRLALVSRAWKRLKSSTVRGSTATTSRASRALMTNITTTAPTT